LSEARGQWNDRFKVLGSGEKRSTKKEVYSEQNYPSKMKKKIKT